MTFLAIENASSSSSSIPPSSTPGCKYEYDVLLSFRGTDTRNNFTDHLYDRLKQEGIFTFRDDVRLEQGTEINSGLLRAIDESKIAVVVLSKQCASSSWCLIELAKIVERMDKKKLTVLPVFHYVDPSDVRNQRGSFSEAFAKHENRFKDKIDDVKAWRAALTKVANLSGWHLQDNSESEVIKKIIQRINSELDREVPLVSEHLVGMDSRVKELLDLYLGERLNCVRLVGICGMGGIGKTTLAREIYNRIFRDFEARSFIADVREESKSRRLVYLQKNILSTILMGTEKNILDVEEGKKILRKRLCNKKVLIVLDDVNNEEQLKALAGKDWFHPGSIIIVTSRDSHLLNSYWDGVIDIYNAKGLNDDEALELFSLKAFKKPCPEENYVNLSKNFVSYANGLPLALRVLGSSLFGKTPDAWRSARDKLEAKPNRVIMDVLEMSVVGLDDTQRDLFLDIACLFKDMDSYCIRDTLESLGHYTYDIDVLQDKSLLTIASNGALGMHDLVKEMGQDIVRRESPEEPGKRSRLWSYKDVLHVLTSNAGTEVVKGIMLNMPIEAKERLSAEAFSKMKILKFLKIGYMHPPHDLIGGPIQLPQGLSYLSNELRIIDWRGYPLKSMPTSFQPNKLVKLRMHYSDIKQLWKGSVILNELKLIDLSDSQNLIEIPDLSGAQNLKRLILQRCTRLYKIHASLGDHKRLIRLDLNGCKCLESLPHKINLEALETFIISGCSRLKKFAKVVGNMSCLSELSLNETAITGLPLSIEHLIGLIRLDLRDCKNLSSLPNCCYSSMSLKSLNLSGCSKLVKLPENLGNIETLKELDVSRTAITGLPLSIEHLIGLIRLDLRDCKNLSSLPNGCYSSMSLKSLNLSGCSKLVKLPENLGNIETLEELDVSGTAITGLPLSIEHLIGLIKLDLRDCKNLSSLPNCCYSSMSLKILNLSGCSKLNELPKNLGKIKGLEKLDLSGTAITGLPSSVVHLKNLKVLSLSGCVGLSSNKLTRFPLMQPRRSPDPMGMPEHSLIGLCSLTELNLSYCNVQTIPNVLGCLSSLEILNLSGNNFVCLPESIIQLSNLSFLGMGGCTHLQMLPKLPLNIKVIDATECTSLETLSLRPECNFRPNISLLNCNKLIKNQGYGDLFSTMLRHYIINPQGQQDGVGYHVAIPGSEIPKWFSHQNVGGSVNLQVPSDLLGNKLMGIAVCAVFVFRKHHPLHQLHIQDYGDRIRTHVLWCSISGMDGRPGLNFSEEFGKIESYQLLVRYYPSTYFGSYWKEILNQVDTNGFSQIKVEFESSGPGLEVTKCGAHLVSELDIEDLINQTKVGPSNCIITPYDEDGFDESEKDTKIKRSSDDSNGEWAGPSGDATTNKEPTHLNLIENWFGNSNCNEEESQ